MQTIHDTLWRRILGRVVPCRIERFRTGANRPVPLRMDELSDYLLRDLGLPRRDPDSRHRRL